MLKYSRISNIVNKVGIINIFLVTNTFAWYYCIINFFENVAPQFSSLEVTTLWATHFGCIITAAILGALWTNKIQSKNKFILTWLLLGVASSLTALLFNPTIFSHLILIAILFGISLGLGTPALMGFFTQNSKTEHRGHLGGLILLFTGLSIFILGSIVTQNNFMNLLTLSIWRVAGLTVFILAKPFQNNRATSIVSRPYEFIVRQRSFLLFLIPWIVFCLVNYLSTPIQNAILGTATVNYLSLIQNAMVGCFALIGGFLIDLVGRKRMAMVGFILFGLGYSVVGIMSEGLLPWYFFTVITGVAWGILDVTFILTIWGDLSETTGSEKYYAMGMLPFFLSKLLELVIGNSINSLIPTYALFSFIAFFLFLAILPLAYAPETLPEKVMKDRDLKSYVEKAIKKAQSETEKKQKTPNKKPKEDDVEFQINPPEENEEQYEDAKKLAEKYY